ncbi:MAG: sugar phosphate isomerase/epimerase [Lewinella sp.]|nr:sugar phosphate isomerase/epimerase [Lewinella sp.]
MKYNRRNFIQTAGLITGGTIILPQWACKNSGSQTDENAESEDAAPQPSLSEFGIQLYTLRDDIPKDPKGILQQLASFGYKQVEGYEGPLGLFWGMTNTEFKQYMDQLGMNFVSSHCDINTDFETKAAQAGEIGMKYLICPYLGPQKSLDDFKKFAEKFNELGAICKKNGLRFAYHNHDYSFKEQDGEMIQDVMMNNTDPDLVDFEMDIYWVVTGGADPVAYLDKYPNRWRLCHVKDRMKGVPAEEREVSCDLGTGSIDYPAILKAASEKGMQYYIVEQERYDNSTPLQSAKADAAYLKTLVFS